MWDFKLRVTLVPTLRTTPFAVPHLQVYLDVRVLGY